MYTDRQTLSDSSSTEVENKNLIENSLLQYLDSAPSFKQQNLLRLGEITPFDAIKLTQSQHIKQNPPNVLSQESHSDETPAADLSKQLRNQLRHEIVPQDLEQNAKQKTASNNEQKKAENVIPKRTQRECNYKESTEDDGDIGSDEDFIPAEAVYSSDDEDVEDPVYNDLTEDDEDLPVNNKKHSKKANTRKANSKKVPKKSEKIIDDGDFNSFRERMRYKFEIFF